MFKRKISLMFLGAFIMLMGASNSSFAYKMYCVPNNVSMAVNLDGALACYYHFAYTTGGSPSTRCYVKFEPGEVSYAPSTAATYAAAVASPPTLLQGYSGVNCSSCPTSIFLQPAASLGINLAAVYKTGLSLSGLTSALNVSNVKIDPTSDITLQQLPGLAAQRGQSFLGSICPAAAQ